MASHERTTVVPTITMRARLQGVWGSDHSYHAHNNTIITSCSVSSLGWVWARESQKVATLSQDTRAVTSSAETRVVMNTSTTLHLWRYQSMHGLFPPVPSVPANSSPNGLIADRNFNL